MSNNSTKTLFLTTLIGGVMITISSNSWLGAWMGLEINLLSFIPIMSGPDNIYTSEASLKYFLVQALASSILLFLVISKTMLEEFFSIMNFDWNSMMLMTPLLLKSGAAPFHWWFPSVMEGLSWMNCFILMTVQKIAPLILMSYTLKFTMFTTFIIISSVLIGSIGGYNQISLRKIMTYSSINHIGWMMTSMLLGENIWIMYFTIYSMLTLTILVIIQPFQISYVNQTFLINKDNPLMKFLLFTSLLSLGGLPPFLGFLPKWLVIQMMINNGMITLVTIMVTLSLITLYYYLRISYASFLILHDEPSWNINSSSSKILIFTYMLGAISMLGLALSTILTSFY